MKRRLLLIDNDPVQIKVKRLSLQRDYDVDCAKSAQQAQDFLSSNNHTPYDLIVVDMLPIRERYIDVVTLTQNLEYDPAILVISHLDIVERYINCINDVPFMDIVIKPFAINQLQQRIDGLLSENKPARLRINPFTLDDIVAQDNNHFFMQHLSRCWIECIKVNQPISMLYINIDYFALMRSFAGNNHAYHCLRVIQAMVNSLIYRRDDMAVRARRDDFYIVLPACKEYGVKQKIERIQGMLHEALLTNEISPLSPFVSVSIGYVTQTPKTLDELDVFVQLAKARLDKAKEDRDRLLSKSANF